LDFEGGRISYGTGICWDTFYDGTSAKEKLGPSLTVNTQTCCPIGVVHPYRAYNTNYEIQQKFKR